MQEGVGKIKLNIGGMTCVHCQQKIAEGLQSAEGVLSCEVSYADGTAEITYDTEKISRVDMEKIIGSLGYKVLPDTLKKDYSAVYALIVTAVIVLAYLVLQFTGALNYLAPGGVADSGTGYGMLFVIGLATSVHCIAMCGGINLSQCLPKPEDEVQKGFKTFAPALLYNLGRVVSYTFIGFVLGLIGWLVGGSSASIPPLVQGIIKIAAGFLMVVMGLNMLGIIPVLRKINLRLPRVLARKVGKKKSSSKSPLIVGILNGIMPCGPLQSMWLVALATGSPVKGALSMFLFAAGTVPLMLGLGSLVAKLGQKFTKSVTTAGSVLVVVLGFAMLSQGGSLSGLGNPRLIAEIILAVMCVGVLLSLPVKKVACKAAAQICAFAIAVCSAFFLFGAGGYAVRGDFDEAVEEDGYQVVTSVLEPGSYPNISVKKGIPVVWKIQADEGSINGCNYKVIISEYGLEHVFGYGENVIEFTPTEVGTFSYGCWMGMITATIAVTD